MSIDNLYESELLSLGPMMYSASVRSQEDFQVSHMYFCSLNEDKHYHLHWHVVPRADSIPENKRGPSLLVDGDQSPDDAVHRSLILLVADKLHSAISMTSPYNRFTHLVGTRLRESTYLKKQALDLYKRQAIAQAWAGDIYVLTTLVLVLIANLLVGYGNLTLDGIMACLVGLRWLDIVNTQLGIVILHVMQPGHSVVSVSRSIVLALLNVFQVILIFAVLYSALQDLQGQAFVDGSFQDPGLKYHVIHTLGEFVYLSWTTLLTLGSNYTATTLSAKGLIMVEVASGLPLLAVALSAFISARTIQQIK